MKIALMYLDVSNLGDTVIYNTADYLIRKVIENNNIEDCKIVPVDIGSYKKDFMDEKSLPFGFHAEEAMGEKIKKFAKKKVVKFSSPAASRSLLKKYWHSTKEYQYYRITQAEKLKGADLIIFGGGGLIKYHAQNFHYFLDEVISYADKHNIPVLLNSQGVEGYNVANPECQILKHALNMDVVKSVTTRDDFKLLSEKYIENPNISIDQVCDPAFWIKETYGIKDVPTRKNVIGLNVIRPAIFKRYLYAVEEEGLMEMYRELVVKLLDGGYHVEFFSNGVTADTEFINELLDKYPEIKNSDRVTVALPDTAAELVELIAGYDRYMAVRLHASIIGSVLGVPNISLVWNNKQIMFGEQIGLPENYLTKGSFNAETIYNALVNAKAYELDESYKQTVYDSLENQILKVVKENYEEYIPWEETKQKPIIVSRAKSSLKRRIKKRTNRKAKEKSSSRIDRLTKKYRDEVSVVDNRIVIMSNTFRYTCNPKYISEQLAKDGKEYEVIWLVDNNKTAETYPENVKTLIFDSEEGVKAVYSAKVWIDNGIAFSEYFEKKEEQIHIQTMHGSLGIKRLDNAVISRLRRGEDGETVVRRECENTNYVLTNSKFEEDVFRGVFWEKTPMERLGHARTDILFSADEKVKADIRKRLEEEYNIPADKKLVLFAPTHRKGLRKNALFFDIDEVVKALKDKCGADYVILLRLHNRSTEILSDIYFDEFVYDATDYPDIQELMLVSEVGITDYSSWIYDYVYRRKPGFIYATDVANYNNRTGLYYPLEETPFPVCASTEDLVEAIKNFDDEYYNKRIDEFLADKESVDDGRSAERIVEWIKTIAPVK